MDRIDNATGVIKMIACALPAATAGLLVALPGTAVAASPSGEYGHWGINTVIVLVTGVVVCACALLHYEVLNFISHWLAGRERQRRRRMLFAIFGILSAHVAEIWIFGLGYALLWYGPAFGTATGIDLDLLDQVYLSALTFTTVGSADVHLGGPIRFLNGMEALTGLVLITWSASFTFLEMQRFWRER